MPRKPVSAIMLTLLLTSMLTLAFNIQQVKAEGTIYIRADGSIDPPDTPVSSVDNVTYTLIGNIYDSIVIERDNIVVDGAGYTVQGTGSGTGLSLSGRSNATIKNTQIRTFRYGIYLYESSNNIISGNNITNNFYGIYSYCYSDSNSISGNNITNNRNGIWLDWGSNYNSISGNNVAINESSPSRYTSGICLWGASNNVILSNAFTNNGLYLYDSYGSVVEGNVVNGKPLVYLEDVSNYAVGDAGQVILVNCYGILVENLNLSYTTVSLELWGTKNSKIANNNIAYSWRGVFLVYSSDHNIIVENNVTANNIGIGLSTYSNNNSISGNNMANNDYDIFISESSHDSISGNNMINSLRGISLSGAYNCSIFGNNMTNNSEYGICLDPASNNFIYHNNFINNTNQAYSYPDENTWDDGYPSGGSFWSDYIGTDLYNGPYQKVTGSDGIGDTPYVIDANNTDRYPLMKAFPWSEHDIGITYIGRVYSFDLVVPLKTVVGLRFSLNISTFVMNYGSQTEIFNVQVFANDTLVDTFANVTLASRQSAILSLRWNTTGFEYGNHTVRAVADNLSGETDISDNAYADGVVYVGIPGDINGDGKVDMKDIGYVAVRFYRNPKDSNWSSNADLDDDGKINMRDIGIAARHFMEHYP